MANLAVVLMQQGQPALLYLVPCTLGVMLWMARGRKELEDLWRGPTALTPPYFSASLLGMSTRESDGGGEEHSSNTGNNGYSPDQGVGTIAVLPPLSCNASREEQNSVVHDGMATI